MGVNNVGGGSGTAFTQGTFAARPAPTANALYYATDTGEWWIANAAGTVWQSIASTSVLFTASNGAKLGSNNFGGVAFDASNPATMALNSGTLGAINTDLMIRTVAKGLGVKEGVNGRQGAATLVAGTVTVNVASITANSRIILTAQDNNTTGALRVSARVVGTSFTITSSNAGDTGVVAYEIFNESA